MSDTYQRCEQSVPLQSLNIRLSVLRQVLRILSSAAQSSPSDFLAVGGGDRNDEFLHDLLGETPAGEFFIPGLNPVAMFPNNLHDLITQNP